MKYEDVIEAVGGCGRYQIFTLNLLYICTAFDGLQIGSMVFIVPEINHRCAIPGLPNDTYEVQSEAHADLIKEYIPETTKNGEIMYSKCQLFTNKTELGNQSLTNCSSWVYDQSIFDSTITSDFNLVCHREWLSHQIFTVFFAGYLFAMLSCGWLSDRLGRKTVIISALIMQGTAGIMSSLIMDYHVILVLRFLTAIGGAGSYIPSVVFGAEISSMKNRTNASIALQMYFTIGYLIIDLLAFVLRSWKLIVLLASLPSIPFAILYIWTIPESPRWLLTMNKQEKAKIVLNKIAETNKCDFSCKSENIEISVAEGRAVKLWKIFTISKLRKITLIMMFNWCVVSFVYFGMVLNSGHLSGDIFLNFMFGAFVEFPAYIICMILLNRLGRKKLYIAFMALAGVCAVITVFPCIYAPNDLQWTTTALAILSKLCITGTFGIIYLHTCELYPTCVRNGALGAHSTFARLGGLLSPYIMMMRHFADGKLGDSLPLMTMGFVCFIAGLSYLFLPETNNRQMDDTFDDIRNRKKLRKDDKVYSEVNMAVMTKA